MKRKTTKTELAVLFLEDPGTRQTWPVYDINDRNGKLVVAWIASREVRVMSFAEAKRLVRRWRREATEDGQKSRRLGYRRVVV